MPEGPEVEYNLQCLKEFEGEVIKSIKLTDISQKYKKYKGKQQEFSGFSGSILKTIERHGKFLVWIFDNNETILNHLGMSGKWVIIEKEKKSEIKHSKVIVSFRDLTSVIIFDDARNFGQFRKYRSYEEIMNYQPIKKLGLDGLKIPFPMSEFHITLLQNKNLNKAIGRVLLDQSMVAGIGNIYKSESLFLAKINPLRLVIESLLII